MGMKVESTFHHLRGIEKAHMMQTVENTQEFILGYYILSWYIHPFILSVGPDLLYSGGVQRSSSKQGGTEGVAHCPSLMYQLDNPFPDHWEPSVLLPPHRQK